MLFPTSMRRLFLASLASMMCSQALASVVITGTRLIYPSDQKEITVQLTNNGSHPALIQSWIDSGDSESTPTQSTAPFLLTPPVARVDPGKGQTLRLMFTGKSLPQTKESVYWLNVLDIPPAPDAGSDVNMLQMAFRSRIKIFYRPSDLIGNATDAIKQVQWKVITTEKGYALQAFNPSAFHVSLIKLTLVSGTRRDTGADGMIGPGETRLFAMPTLKGKPSKSARVEFDAINDFGALLPTEMPLNP